jgi:hypothetical protein
MIQLNYDPPPKSFDLIPFRIGAGEDYDFTWLEENHEILLKIKCEDGIFLLLKVPVPDENCESRVKMRKPKNDVLGVLGQGDTAWCERDSCGRDGLVGCGEGVRGD